MVVLSVNQAISEATVLFRLESDRLGVTRAKDADQLAAEIAAQVTRKFCIDIDTPEGQEIMSVMMEEAGKFDE